MVQAHHERNQHLTVRPELVEGLVQRIPNYKKLENRRKLGRSWRNLGIRGFDLPHYIARHKGYDLIRMARDLS